MGQDILEIIRSRRSVRRFAADPVPDEVIKAVAEAARWAPSPGNRQGCGVIVVRNPEVKAGMAAVVQGVLRDMEGSMPHEDAVQALRDYGNYFTFFAGAPVVLTVTYKSGTSFFSMLQGKEPGINDRLSVISAAAAAVQNILLTAHSMGYGACWMTGPLVAEERLAGLLAIKPPARIAALIPLGKPAEDAEDMEPPKRKEISKLVRMVD